MSENTSTSPTNFTSFKDFYPYYLKEHSDKTCRRLHFVGTLLVIGVIAASIVLQRPVLLCFAPLVGYGFAWVGHFFFEKNKPATFRHPVYSFLGDWVMFKDMLLGNIKL